MMRSDTETFGVSMSTGCVRGVVVDGGGRLVEARTSFTDVLHPLTDASTAATDMSAELGWARDAPVMAVGGDPEDVYGPGGVRLIGECDAFLAAARMDGSLEFARTVAIVDLGRVGTRVHVLDTSTGELYFSAGTAELSGDAIDAAVAEYLAATFGAAEKMSPAAVQNLARDSVVAKEMLSDERAVDLSGPFVVDPVRLRRTDFELLVAPLLAEFLGHLGDAVAQGVDAVLLVGGGAHIPFLQRVVTEHVAVPMVVARYPQHFAALGAAHLSTVIPPAPVSAPIPVPEQFPADDSVTTVLTPVSRAVLPTPPPARSSVPVRRSRPARRRRRSRVGVVVGTSALLAAVTLGAAAAASGQSEDVDVRSADRVVVTSSVSPTIAETTTPDTESPQAPPATTSVEPSTRTSTTTTTSVTDVTDAPSTTAVTEPTPQSRRPVAAPTQPQEAASAEEESPMTTTRRPNNRPTTSAVTTVPSTPATTTPRPTTTVPTPTSTGTRVN